MKTLRELLEEAKLVTGYNLVVTGTPPLEDVENHTDESAAGLATGVVVRYLNEYATKIRERATEDYNRRMDLAQRYEDMATTIDGEALWGNGEEGFHEPDEPVEDVKAAFDAGLQSRTTNQ